MVSLAVLFVSWGAVFAFLFAHFRRNKSGTKDGADALMASLVYLVVALAAFAIAYCVTPSQETSRTELEVVGYENGKVKLVNPADGESFSSKVLVEWGDVKKPTGYEVFYDCTFFPRPSMYVLALPKEDVSR